MPVKLLISLLILIAGFTVLLLGHSAQVNATVPNAPVVVELFTSEGCSSCPPADRLLADLQQQHTLDGAQLILLGEHVDYWNGLGWKDRFSSPDFTARQTRYVRQMGLSSNYTPQAVVDGHTDVSGNDVVNLKRAIADAASSAKAAQVNLSWAAADQLTISVKNATNSHVVLALTEDGLTTKVRDGENGGRTLNHAAVVRELRDLGSISQPEWKQTVATKWNSEWSRSNSHFVVLVQAANGRIIGAAALSP